MLNRQTQPRRRQGGLSLVELMVGITIGLIVVAAATVLVSTQLSENRRLLLETQLQQDLRATADIVTRELRRVGTLPDEVGPPLALVPLSVQTIWTEGTLMTGPSSKSNCFARGLALPSTGGVLFDYVASDSTLFPGPYGYKLENNVVYTRLPAVGVSACFTPTSPAPSTGWQPLTDPKVMRVRAFNVTLSPPLTADSVRIPCPNLCPADAALGLAAGHTQCWPHYRVRELRVTIEGESLDGLVKRAVTSAVRVRADLVEFNDPAGDQICPS